MKLHKNFKIIGMDEKVGRINLNQSRGTLDPMSS